MESSTKEISLMATSMAKANISGKVGISTLDSSGTTKGKESEAMCGLMGAYTKGNGEEIG